MMVVESGTIKVVILPLFNISIIANIIVAVRKNVMFFFFVYSFTIAGLDPEECIASLGSVDVYGG